MLTAFLILLASTAYFALASRKRDAHLAEIAEDAPTRSLLAIEPERDEAGYHAAVIDLGDDAVLYVTNSFAAVRDAIQAAQEWIDLYQ